MTRKSKEPSKINTNKVKEREIFIVEEKRPPRVEDFLPNFKYKYEGIEEAEESKDIVQALNNFIKENEEVVLREYTSKDIEAVQEGFKRAIAISELFIKSMYLEGGDIYE